MNIILMGCPGAGKGTQSARLKETFGLTHISTGDMLRSEMAAGSALGKQVSALINQGSLVPDELMISMLEKVISQAQKALFWTVSRAP